MVLEKKVILNLHTKGLQILGGKKDRIGYEAVLFIVVANRFPKYQQEIDPGSKSSFSSYPKKLQYMNL